MKEGVAIQCQNVSKTYRINRSSGHTTLAEALAARWRGRTARSPRETFLALDDISLDVAFGDVVGVVGRNGAGKSTLLKVLARVTSPSGGRVDMLGRVGSLLEVGTGFHPELTGRENIFLNGSILGMTTRDIKGKFEEIVEFAGVQRFLETPVKRYSSGMYIRLAFAVAAHLDADILLVDEVLAVGDAQFQQKCIGKMKDAASEGRAVFFVSHQMQSVVSLCNRGVVLDKGRVLHDGTVAAAVEQYTRSFESLRDEPAAGRRGTGEMRLLRLDASSTVFQPQDVKRFSFLLEATAPTAEVYGLSLDLVSPTGAIVATLDSRHAGFAIDGSRAGFEGEFVVRNLWLQAGRYRVDAKLHRIGPWVDVFDGACHFDVTDTLPYGSTAPLGAAADGVVLADFTVELST